MATKTLTLTRKEHDILLDKLPEWMKNEFPKFKTKWMIGGVFIYGVDEDTFNMICGTLWVVLEK